MIKFNKKNSTFKDKVEKIKQKINKKDPSYVGLGLLQNNRHMDPRQAHMLGHIYKRNNMLSNHQKKILI